MIYSKKLMIQTNYEKEIVDITELVEKTVKDSKIENGNVLVFTKSSTSAITTIEYEDGLIEDLGSALDRIIPKNIEYEHEKRWHDGNGHSHVRASLLKPDLTVPVIDRKLMLGTWQQIVFVELDVRPRNREIIVQVCGK